MLLLDGSGCSGLCGDKWRRRAWCTRAWARDLTVLEDLEYDSIKRHSARDSLFAPTTLPESSGGSMRHSSRVKIISVPTLDSRPQSSRHQAKAENLAQVAAQRRLSDRNAPPCRKRQAEIRPTQKLCCTDWGRGHTGRFVYRLRYTNHHNIHRKGSIGPFCIIMALVVGAVDVTVAAGLVVGVPNGGSVMDFDHPKQRNLEERHNQVSFLA
jgi:hypothetical protein